MASWLVIFRGLLNGAFDGIDPQSNGSSPPTGSVRHFAGRSGAGDLPMLAR
jgi:hypothetical protein